MQQWAFLPLTNHHSTRSHYVGPAVMDISIESGPSTAAGAPDGIIPHAFEHTQAHAQVPPIFSMAAAAKPNALKVLKRPQPPDTQAPSAPLLLEAQVSLGAGEASGVNGQSQPGPATTKQPPETLAASGGGVDSSQLSNALSALRLHGDSQEGVKGSDSSSARSPSSTGAAIVPDQAPASGAATVTGVPELDPTLISALRNGRDRAFVIKQEIDMIGFVRDAERTSWELPLMNSYQRLLVHRLADQFLLVHSIDPHTKAVCLTKRTDSNIPHTLPSVRATALVPPEVQSAPATRPQAFKIMRRDPSASTTRAQSPHLSAQDDLSHGGSSAASGSANGARRDRRNMTIEEREAAYREARERIFQGFSEAEAKARASHKGKEVDGEQQTPLQQQGASVAEGTNAAALLMPFRGDVEWAGMTRRQITSKAALRPSAPAFDPSARSSGRVSAEPNGSSGALGHAASNGNRRVPPHVPEAPLDGISPSEASFSTASSSSRCSSRASSSRSYQQQYPPHAAPGIAPPGWQHPGGHPLHDPHAVQYSQQPIGYPPISNGGSYSGPSPGPGASPGAEGYYPAVQGQPGFDPTGGTTPMQIPQGMYQAGIVQGVPVFAMTQTHPGYLQQQQQPQQQPLHAYAHPQGAPWLHYQQQQQPQHAGPPGPLNGHAQSGCAGVPPYPHSQGRSPMQPGTLADLYPGGHAAMGGPASRSRSSPSSGLSVQGSDYSGRAASRSSSAASGLDLCLVAKKSPSHDTSSVVVSFLFLGLFPILQTRVGSFDISPSSSCTPRLGHAPASGVACEF
ncbi:hypothetical protein K437DRAFT_253976 [Tilletiaria anomala UBC 951]|uniref:SUZ domain-containing protein n=1 Tax=Tilletiaria anomala (strain ATCC 24038 / CBS 436.72 / UBC 951) TaxID=1037660 RepID=A0A066WJ41_TILAU|nr:uncharacterized protein K437DRAFT_253976 [Tilletiaria anomala UBC 951]KDN52573.1 hypothetical protein K437DRAFT_253976 [Tilletiaria anomala UBC 951]